MLPMSRRGIPILNFFAELFLFSLAAASPEFSCGSQESSSCVPSGLTDATSLLQTQAAVHAHREGDSDPEVQWVDTKTPAKEEPKPKVVWMAVEKQPAPASTAAPPPKVSWVPVAPSPPASTTTAPSPAFSWDGASCTPHCSWNCSDSKIDQVCRPMCKPPVCTTQCGAINVSACTMECQKPHCAVVCPLKVSQDNPCDTSCSPPICKMTCKDSEKLGCKNVCKTPDCKWECAVPDDVKKPKCKLQCEKPGDGCNMTTGDDASLLEGQFLVEQFPAPSSLAEAVPPGKVATFRVPVKRMSVDNVLEISHHIDLPVQQIGDTLRKPGDDTLRKAGEIMHDLPSAPGTYSTYLLSKE